MCVRCQQFLPLSNCFDYKRLVLLLLTAFICFFATAALGQQSNTDASEAHVTAETNISGVRAFVAPPKEFDFQKASPTELAKYGLLPKPDREKFPQAYVFWKDLVEGSRYRVIPTLEKSDIVHGPVKGLVKGQRAS